MVTYYKALLTFTLILNWGQALATTSRCENYPIEPSQSIDYNSLFASAKLKDNFRPESIFSISGRDNTGFFQVAPGAFIDVSNGQFHQLNGEILRGSQDGSTLYYQDSSGHLKLYDVQTRTSSNVPGVRNEDISECRAEQNISTLGKPVLVHHCKYRDQSSVLVFGDGSGRVVNLNRDQTEIFNSSHTESRFMHAGQIQIRSDNHGILNISPDNNVAASAPSPSGQNLWVNPDVAGQSYELQIGNSETSGIYLVQGSSRNLIQRVSIPEGTHPNTRVIRNRDSISIYISYSNHQEVVRINIASQTPSVLTMDDRFREDAMVLESDRGPYLYGRDSRGRVQRVALADFSRLSQTQARNQRFVFRVERQTSPGSQGHFINNRVLVDISGDELNIYPNEPAHMVCVPTSEITVSASRCEDIVAMDATRCEQAASNPIRRRGATSERALVQWLAARASIARINLESDLGPLVGILRSDIPSRYPELVRRVLQNIYIRNHRLYSRLHSQIGKIAKLNGSNTCPINYESCLSDADSRSIESAVRSAGEVAASTGDVSGLQLFSDQVGTIPESQRQDLLGRIALARARTQLQISLSKEGSPDRFEQVAVARAESLRALGIESMGDLDGGAVVRANWECPNSLRRSPPRSMPVSIRYLPDAQMLDLSGLDSLMSQLESHSYNDFTPCLAKLMLALSTELGDSLRGIGMDDLSVDRAQREAYEQLQARTFQYAMARQGDGATSFLVPATPMQPPIHREITESLLSDINRCKFPPSPYMLDARFLRILASRRRMVDNLSSSCRSNLETNYTQAINASLMNQRQCRERAVECQMRVSNVSTAIQNLMDAGIIRDQDYQQLASNSCDTTRTPASYLTTLFNIQNEIQEANQCTPMRDNETRDININKAIGGRYRLRKLRGNEFQVSLKIKLTDGNTGHTNTPRTNEVFERMNSCFQEHQDQFRGPEGELLSFRFERADGEDKSARDVHTIRVHEQYERANSGNYPQSITCATIIHEVMHLLGLVDEYHEHARGFVVRPSGAVEHVTEDAHVADYNCRVVGPSDSLMNNQAIALSTSSPKTNARGETYQSLLYPGQFRFITNPLCDRVNERYNSCSSAAYQSSSNNLMNNFGHLHGRMSCPAGFPEYCSDASGGWLQ